MSEYSRRWPAVLLALLAWGLMWGTVAAGDPGPQILLAVTDDAAVGQRAELVARVTSPEGEPLEGVDVAFVAEVEFLNTFDTVAIGSAVTDESGVARTF